MPIAAPIRHCPRMTDQRPLKSDNETNPSPHNTMPAVSIQSLAKVKILAKFRLMNMDINVETDPIKAAVEGVPMFSLSKKMLRLDGNERNSMVTKKYVKAAEATGPEK